MAAISGEVIYIYIYIYMRRPQFADFLGLGLDFYMIFGISKFSVKCWSEAGPKWTNKASRRGEKGGRRGRGGGFKSGTCLNKRCQSLTAFE